MNLNEKVDLNEILERELRKEKVNLSTYQKLKVLNIMESVWSTAVNGCILHARVKDLGEYTNGKYTPRHVLDVESLIQVKKLIKL